MLAGWLDSERRAPVIVTEPIPFGHKLALGDIAERAEVTEYAVRIGLSRQSFVCQTARARDTCARGLGHRAFVVNTLYCSA